MATSTTVADAALTAFGAVGSPAERETLRYMAAAAYSDWSIDRAHGTAVELADRARSIGQGIADQLSRPDQVAGIVSGKDAPAARAALVTAFRAAGLR